MMIRTARCRSCDAGIVWMKTAKGKNIPVDEDSIDEGELEYLADTPPGVPLFDPENHVTHFATCPDADTHRRRS